MMQGDVHGMIKDSMALGFLPMDVDLEVLEPELQHLYDMAQVPQIIQAVAEGGSAYKAVVTRRKRMLTISYELNKFFFKYPFMIPDYFALLIRSMVVLEGIAVTGDPAFDLFSSAYPYALRRAVKLFGLKNTSTIALEAVKAALQIHVVGVGRIESRIFGNCLSE